MLTRHKSREIALEYLYSVDQVGKVNRAPLETFFDHFHVAKKSREFAQSLIEGVMANQKRIDKIISDFSYHWELSRMGKVDRNILRISIYELLYLEDIPLKVTINEGVELAKKFGTERSSAFINGILDRVCHEFLGEEEKILSAKSEKAF